MKKILSITLSAVVALLITSCADDEYTSKYNNPSKSSTVSCDKLFTGVLYNGRTYACQTYWGLCTFELPQIGAYAQTASHFTDDADYEGTGSYVSYDNDRWTNFYNDLTQYKLMLNTFNSLSDGEKANNQLFMDCATVFIYDELETLIDLFGDVPFADACKLQISGNMTDAKVAYDDAATLYTMMLNGATLTTSTGESISFDGLGTLYDRIKSAKGGEAFIAQDMFFKGDVATWARYALGLRARMALRVSTQGSLTTTGQAVLKEIKSSLETFSDDCLAQFANPSVVAFCYNDGNGMNWGGGWNEWARQYSRLTLKMAEALNIKDGDKMDHANNTQITGADPRAAVMYDASNKFTIHPLDWRDGFDTQYAQWGTESGYRYFTVVDSATFINNAYFQPAIMSKAEVFLTLAEAAQRGYITGSAESYFKQGVQASIDLYYKENSLSVYRDPVIQPDATEYINNIWTNATDKLEAICTQYWLHFSLLQPTQSYNNVRRTGFPVLQFRDLTGNSSKNLPLPVDRLPYAQNETDNNNANKMAAIQKLSDPNNECYNNVFWAKNAKSWYQTVSVDDYPL